MYRSPGPSKNGVNENWFLINGTCASNGTVFTPEKLFWESKVLDMSESLSHPGSLNFPIILCLAISWIICWIIVARGIKTAGPASWVLAVFPYFILTAMLIRAVTLPGAIDGITLYLKPNFTRLLD